MTWSRIGGVVLAALALSACVSGGVRQSAPPVSVERARAEQVQREFALGALPRWKVVGRAAISQGDKGGSGRLEWSQDGEAARISLAAPVTRQSWELILQPGQLARLEGLEGGTRQGQDPAQLLREATGWDIPVQALAWWVRGLPAPGQTGLVFGPDGRPLRLEAEGWLIEYQEWSPPVGPFPAMPRRLQASKGVARVRLVLDGWERVQ